MTRSKQDASRDAHAARCGHAHISPQLGTHPPSCRTRRIWMRMHRLAPHPAAAARTPMGNWELWRAPSHSHHDHRPTTTDRTRATTASRLLLRLPRAPPQRSAVPPGGRACDRARRTLLALACEGRAQTPDSAAGTLHCAARRISQCAAGSALAAVICATATAACDGSQIAFGQASGIRHQSTPGAAAVAAWSC